MMDEISVDTPCDFPEKVLKHSSKLRLIVFNGGANSAHLDAPGFYF